MALNLAKIWHCHFMEDLFYHWLDNSSQKSQFGPVVIALCFYGCWEIWKSRCKPVFQGAGMGSGQITERVKEQFAGSCSSAEMDILRLYRSLSFLLL